MDHPLDGARLKVVWADKHLQTLKNEIAAYLDTKPYEFVPEQDGDKVAVQEATIKPGCPSPKELSCIVSECVGPLRSALNYVAWQLAVKHAPSPPVVGKDRGIFFPILDATTGDGMDRFDKMAKKYAFPANAIKLIKDVQPYNAGYDPLKILASLTNADKHCLPLLTVAYAKTASMQIEHVTGSRVETVGSGVVRVGVSGTSPIQVEFVVDTWAMGEGVAGIKAALKTPDPLAPRQEPRDVKVDGQVSVFVALKDAPVPFEPVQETIARVFKCVSDIVPRFEQFF